MRSVLAKCTLLLLLGLLSVIASSCSVPTTPASTPSSSSSIAFLSPSSAIQVSPDSTDPATLNVEVAINEDQTVSDGESEIMMQFSTIRIRNANYVQFNNGEKIICNNVSLTFADAVYSARVGAVNGAYTCVYRWANGTSVIVSILARTQLQPRLVTDASGHSFIVVYNPDQVNACPVRVDASDGLQTVTGPTVAEAANGVVRRPGQEYAERSRHAHDDAHMQLYTGKQGDRLQRGQGNIYIDRRKQRELVFTNLLM